MIRQTIVGLIQLTAIVSLGATTLTSASNDVTSPDGRLVAWVKATPGRLVSTGLGDEEATELWVRSTSNGTGRMLMRGHWADDTRYTIAKMDNLHFSLDGRTIYFDSMAWATSGAVHAVDVESGQEWFITDGSILEVMQSGKTAGNLLIDRFLIKMDAHGESTGRNVYRWMYTKDGFAIAELGPAEAQPKSRNEPNSGSNRRR